MNKFLTFEYGQQGSEFAKHWVLVIDFKVFGVYISGLKNRVLMFNILKNG